MNEPPTLTLKTLAGTYAICRLAADADVSWAAGELVMVARAKGEALPTTVICDETRVPEGVERDAGWHAVKLVGPFAFGETGILASVLGVLAEARVPVLAVTTFETDYLLVKAERFERVRQALEEAGHSFID